MTETITKRLKVLSEEQAKIREEMDSLKKELDKKRKEEVPLQALEKLTNKKDVEKLLTTYDAEKIPFEKWKSLQAAIEDRLDDLRDDEEIDEDNNCSIYYHLQDRIFRHVSYKNKGWRKECERYDKNNQYVCVFAK